MWQVDHDTGWWMIWGGLMMILFWGAIIGVVVWAIQALTRRESSQTQASRPGAPQPAALDIAEERYARGDITREEFEQIKMDLAGS